MRQTPERKTSKVSVGVLTLLVTASLGFNVYFWQENLMVNMASISRLCGQSTSKALAQLKGERFFKPDEFEKYRTTRLASAGWKPELDKTESEGVIVQEGPISMALLYVTGGKVTKIARLKR